MATPARRVTPAPLVPPDHPASQGQQQRWYHVATAPWFRRWQVQEDQLGLLVPPALRDPQELTESLVIQVKMDLKALLDHQASLESQETPGSKERRVTVVRASQAPGDLQGPPDNQRQPDTTGRPLQTWRALGSLTWRHFGDCLVCLALLASPGPQVPLLLGQGSLAYLAPKVPQDRMVLLVNRVYTACLVLMVAQELQGPGERRVIQVNSVFQEQSERRVHRD